MKRLIPPFVVLGSIIIMFILDHFIPGQAIISKPWTDIGIIFILIGLYLVISSGRLIKREQTQIDTFKTPLKLLTSNLFAFSRNPIYLGFTSLLLGIAVCLGSFSPFLLVINFFCMSNFWYIPIEEKNMELAFGEEYNNYKKTVRRWI